MTYSIIENNIDGFKSFSKSLYKDNNYYSDEANSSDLSDFILFTLEIEGRVFGRIACIDKVNFTYRDYNVGLIAFYECDENSEYSNALFENAQKYLQSKGCNYIIGPMNGSTWNQYRLAADTNKNPFFLDRISKSYYPSQFDNYGFDVIAKYHSSKTDSLSVNIERLNKFTAYYKSKDIVIRNIDLSNYESEIRKIYEISIAAFKDNFLYSEISFEEMYSMYNGLKHLIDPSLIYICEDAEENPLAFLFATKDLLSPHLERYIIKSAAVVPSSKAKGLGTYLSELIHHQLFTNGAKEIIHALMYQDNLSQNVLGNNTEIIAEYLLYGKEI